jgi:hypothetical protein
VLPDPLHDELALEAEREGVSPNEHAVLLLYLATALLSEGSPTPFQEAVRRFLGRYSLDYAQIRSALQELVRASSVAQETEPFVEADGPFSLKESESTPVQERSPELVARVKRVRGKFARGRGERGSEELHRERQADKEREEHADQGRRP